MILALETATLEAGVALIDGAGAIVAQRQARVSTHSERLLPLCAEVLAEAGIPPSGLAAVACGAGPGSFTGLRIGLATAKGLCLALGRPLLMVSSLAALALRAPRGSRVVACIDAFKGEVYAGRFLRLDDDDPRGPLLAAGPERVLAPDRLAAELAVELSLPHPPIHLVGEVLEHWPVLALAELVLTDRGCPDAASVARLARRRLARGESDDLAAAVPTYIRPSEAEILGPPADRTPSHKATKS